MPNQTTQTYALSVFQAAATRAKARSRAKARQEQKQKQKQKRRQGKEIKKEQSCSFYHSLLSSLQTNQCILVAQFIRRVNPKEIMGQSI